MFHKISPQCSKFSAKYPSNCTVEKRRKSKRCFRMTFSATDPCKMKGRLSKGRLKVPDLDMFDPFISHFRLGPAGGPNPTEVDLDRMLIREIARHRERQKAINQINHPAGNLAVKSSPEKEIKREDSFTFPILTPSVFTYIGLVEELRTPPHSRPAQTRFKNTKLSMSLYVMVNRMRTGKVTARRVVIQRGGADGFRNDRG